MSELVQSDSGVLEIGTRHSTGAPDLTYSGTPTEIQERLRSDLPPGSVVEVSYGIPGALNWLPVNTLAQFLVRLWTLAGEPGANPDYQLLFVRYDPRTSEVLTQWRMVNTPPLVILGAVSGALALVSYAFAMTIREARVFFQAPEVKNVIEGASSGLLLLGLAAILGGGSSRS